jgi:hypothetical protein
MPPDTHTTTPSRIQIVLVGHHNARDLVKPYREVSRERLKVRFRGLVELTAINILIGDTSLGTFHRFCWVLSLQPAAHVAVTSEVHGTLEGIILPAKDVVPMLRVPVPVSH